MKSAVLILALALSSCATCERYPRTCAVAGVLAGTALVISASNHAPSSSAHSVTVQPVDCGSLSCQ